MLVFDHFKAHVIQNAKAIAGDLKTQIVVIPGGLTSQLKPLDVSVNKLFKVLVKKEWMSWMQSVGNDLTPTGRTKKASIAQVCDWILRSWSNFKKEVVVKLFKNEASAMLQMELTVIKFPGLRKVTLQKTLVM